MLNHRIVNSVHASSAQANQAFDEFAKELAFMLDPAARVGKFLQTAWDSLTFDNFCDFVYGWIDTFTVDTTKYYRQAMGWDFANYDSLAYQSGAIVGMVHGFAFSFAGGAAWIGFSWPPAEC